MSSVKGKDDYLVGILTALPIERAAVRAMLDEEHQTPFDFARHPIDPNSYTWGTIAGHNVVLASLSAGVYGTTSATTTIIPMKYAFPAIKWGLMVGIAAGIPSEDRDIRLGDVVVSQPKDNSGGVFQYDFGKVKDNDDWQSVGWLARPPEILLRALSNLQSEHEFRGPSQAQQHLQDAIHRYSDWGKRYGFPKNEVDRLFQASYPHQKPSRGCAQCDITKVIERFDRGSSNFHIHYGAIGSGNSLVKDALFRDRIAARMDQCICLEMEAAGMVNDFPCLVIRGICDYADSHKNDGWQRYASATAAAFAKELLGFMSTIESRNSVRPEVQSPPNLDNFKITNQTNNPTPAATMNGSTVYMSDPEPMQDQHYGTIPGTFEPMMPERMIPHVTNHTDNFGPKQEIYDTDSISVTNTLFTEEPEPIVQNPLLTKVMQAGGDLSDIDKQVNNSGDTLLIRAAKDGDCDMVGFLLDHGANIHAKNIHDSMAIHKAASYGHVEVVRLLLDRKADLEAIGADKWRALHDAAAYGHVGVVKLLIQRGAHLETVSKNRWTALHIAADRGRLEVVRVLLSSRADPLVKTNMSKQPYELAKEKGHKEIMKLLREHGGGPRTFFKR